MEFMMQNQTYMMKYVQAIFDQDDTNSDGVISEEEFMKSFEETMAYEKERREQEFMEYQSRANYADGKEEL